MHYEVCYSENKMIFFSIFKAIEFFKELTGFHEKEIRLVKSENEEESIFLMKGVYIGHGSDIMTKGYRIYENNEVLYDIKLAEHKHLHMKEGIA